MKRTPGLWTAVRACGSDYAYDIVADAGRRVVATTICAEHEGNARLLAAAPKMKALLEVVLAIDSEELDMDERLDALEKCRERALEIRYELED